VPEQDPASSIEFRLDTASGVPTYLQLVLQVEQALRVGYLQGGDQLPRIRDVVSSLAINPNTVHKAYRELESRGLVAGRPGLGTFIAGSLGEVGQADQARLRRGLLEWLRTAVAAGLDEDGLQALFTSTVRELHDRHDGAPASRHTGRGRFSVAPRDVA
jgi:GntR family transcriptional regulator